MHSTLRISVSDGAACCCAVLCHACIGCIWRCQLLRRPGTRGCQGYPRGRRRTPSVPQLLAHSCKPPCCRRRVCPPQTRCCIAAPQGASCIRTGTALRHDRTRPGSAVRWPLPGRPTAPGAAPRPWVQHGPVVPHVQLGRAARPCRTRPSAAGQGHPDVSRRLTKRSTLELDTCTCLPRIEVQKRERICTGFS